MRLLDLEPTWCSTGGEGVTRDGKPVPLREKIGLICNCPKCGADHPLFVPFANPPDGGPPTHPVAWTIARKNPNLPLTTEESPPHDEDELELSFERITLTPSILRKDCGWHGFITNGQIVGA